VSGATVGSFDVAIAGGGLVGAAIAYGCAGLGQRVALFDEGDVALRAARGNFGLVWVQSKGDGMPEYAAWTRRSSDLWLELAPMLEAETGVDVGHSRPGGVHICLSEEEMAERAALMARLHNQTGGAFTYEMLDRAGVARLMPAIGPDVVGGSYCPYDGHASPLYLLRALMDGLQKRGGRYLPGTRIDSLAARPGGGFAIAAGGKAYEAGKLVLAAGHGNGALAPQVGLSAPVRPLRGQILVTERTSGFLDMPTVSIRQTAEGSVMLGDSHEDVGFDDGTRPDVQARIAARAVRTFPHLARLRIVRTWGALRIMTPDGFPIYEESRDCPGAFLATCHSGVTLAGAHSLALAPHIATGALAAELAPFGLKRFAGRA
jgi:glycine/D-amino acid oxidase-like deaminating enzyme